MMFLIESDILFTVLLPAFLTVTNNPEYC
jgi:hypothetical protein